MADQYAVTPAWATKKIANLASVYVANLTPGAIEIWVRQIVNIVGKNEPDEPGAEASEGRKKLGTVRPGEWLFEHWAATQDRFPRPVQLRRMYQQYWPPADGVSAGVGEDES